MYPFRSEAIFDTVIPLKMMTNAFYLNLIFFGSQDI